MGSFGRDVNRFALVVEKANESIMRSTAIELFTGILIQSPKDTGLFQANWFVTGKQPSTKTTKSTTAKPDAILKKVKSLQDWSIFHFTNSLPYANVLEFGGYPNPPKSGSKTINGFSKMAPNGMVRVTIRKFNAIIAKNARKKK